MAYAHFPVCVLILYLVLVFDFQEISHKTFALCFSAGISLFEVVIVIFEVVIVI